MAWSNPRTWSTNELVTASLLNTHIRDNLNYLKSMVSAQIMLSAAGGTPSTTNGCADPAQTETTTNKVNFYTADFDASAIEYIEWDFPLPSDYDGGTITAKFYWLASDASTNSVVWGLQGVAMGDNAAIDAAWGTAQTVTDANNASDYYNVSAETAAITIAGTPVAGKVAHIRAYRNATDAADTLAVDAKLRWVVLTYTRS